MRKLLHICSLFLLIAISVVVSVSPVQQALAEQEAARIAKRDESVDKELMGQVTYKFPQLGEGMTAFVAPGFFNAVQSFIAENVRDKDNKPLKPGSKAHETKMYELLNDPSFSKNPAFNPLVTNGNLGGGDLTSGRVSTPSSQALSQNETAKWLNQESNTGTYRVGDNTVEAVKMTMEQFKRFKDHPDFNGKHIVLVDDNGEYMRDQKGGLLIAPP
jgi:hypothetical protein